MTTTAFPLCAVTMELAAQLEARGAELFLDWIPWGSNWEADRLADGDWSGFDESLRVHAELGEVRWLVLSELLDAGQRFLQAAKIERGRQKRASQTAGPVGGRRRQKLKEREPW